MRVLREQEDLLARIDEAAYGQHRIFFADVWIEEYRIASRIDHGITSRPCVAGTNQFEHPRRGCNHRIRSGNSANDRVAIPLQPARWPGRVTLHRLRPCDQ